MARRSALARTRRVRGHTQETLAQRLGVDVSSIARWERGMATPSPSVRNALAGELTVSLDELADLLRERSEERAENSRERVLDQRANPVELIKDRWSATDRDEFTARLGGADTGLLTAEHAVRVAHQWLITPAPPAVVETGEDGTRRRRIGTSTLRRLRARLRYLHDADDVVAGGDLAVLIQNELAEIAPLLHTTSYAEFTGREILRILAELCQLAGWSTADAGNTARAEHYYLSGVQAAHAADDPVLAAQVVSSLGYHLAEWANAPHEAVVVTRSALARLDGLARDASHATPAVRAVLLARMAWAHAMAGEFRDADEAIQRGQDEFGRRSGTAADPPWMYWLTPDEMDVIVGRLHTALGRPERGMWILRRALESRDPRRAREVTLYTTWCAQAHWDLDEVDEASRLATQARERSDSIPSAFGKRAVQRLDEQLGDAGRIGSPVSGV